MANNQTPEINIYQKRDFGEKITATFMFIRENWKPLLKYLTLLMLPVSIVQSLCLNLYFEHGMSMLVDDGYPSDDILVSTLGYYMILLLVSIVGGVLFYSMFYALLVAYNRRAERLSGIMWEHLSADFYRFMRRGFALLFFILLIVIAYMVVLALLAWATPATLIVTLPALFVCMVPLALFYPAYMLDNGSRGMVKSFNWSMRNGFRYWGSTFLVVFVCYLLTSIIGGVCSVPWYIVYIFNMVVSFPDEGLIPAQSGTFVSVLQFLFGIIMTYGTYMASVVVMLGITYQYGHISEKVDAVTVDKDIENFDKL